MKCPNCHVSLLISEINHIEIDFCPRCKGVWLDEEDLENVIYSMAEKKSSSHESDDDDYYRPVNYKRRRHKYSKSHYHGQYKRKKRKSLLYKMIDFFD